jgi:hypothetical protein
MWLVSIFLVTSVAQQQVRGGAFAPNPLLATFFTQAVEVPLFWVSFFLPWRIV